MKDKNRFFKRFSRIVSILVLFCYGSAVQLTAQDATFQYEGTYHDYVIPQTTKKYAVLTAVGGDGGRIHFKNLLTDFQVGGGRGGLLKAYFKIGNASNNLKPGSTLRFIVGESGESRLTAGSTGAGGGGGTGIAYKEVGTQEWILLMVAGELAIAGSPAKIRGTQVPPISKERKEMDWGVPLPLRQVEEAGHLAMTHDRRTELEWTLNMCTVNMPKPAGQEGQIQESRPEEIV